MIPPNTNVRFTIVQTSTGCALAKTVTLDESGRLKVIPGGRLSQGKFRTVATPFDQLPSVLGQLSAKEALLWGTEKNGLEAGQIITKKALSSLNGSRAPTMVARTRDYFDWSAGPGVLMLDFDRTPDHISDLDGLREFVISIFPSLRDLPMVAMPSSTACLYNRQNGEPLTGFGKARIYVPTAEASTIPKLGARVHARLQLAGHDLLDAGNWSPEHLDFAGVVHVSDSRIEKRANVRSWNLESGLLLDEALLSALTEAEQAQMAERGLRIKASRHAAAPPQTRLLAPEPRETVLRELAKYLPNTSALFPRRDDYVKVGAAIKAAAGPDHVELARELYLAWAGRWEDGVNDLEVASGDFDRLIPPFAIGYPWLAETARPYGYNDSPFEADLEASTPPEVPLIARLNREYIAVPDGIYCTRDHKIRTPGKVRQYLSSEYGAFKRWAAHPKRARAHTVVFDPTRPPLSLENEVLNTYPGLPLQPDGDGDCRRFIAHLREIVCSGNDLHYRWVMSWLAAIVQRPKEKSGTALVLVQIPGAGKSVVGDVMRKVLGPVLSVKFAHPDQLVGRFNGHLEQRLFILAEEAVWAGNRQAFSVLKDLITADSMSYENKGLTPHVAANYSRILFTSNERRAVPVTVDDRRFTVLEVDDRYAEGKPGAEAYWGALWSEINSGGPAAFLHHLLTYPVNWDLIRHPLQTDARREQQAENLDPLMAWLMDFAHEPPRELGLGPGEFRSDFLYESYKSHINGTAEARYPTKKITFGRWLSSLRRRGLRIESHLTGRRDDRSRSHKFPPLAELRAWLQTQAATPEWDMHDTWPEDELVGVPR
jgi:hypothetical protein